MKLPAQRKYSGDVDVVQLARQALIDLRANPRRTAWMLDEANSIERTIH